MAGVTMKLSTRGLRFVEVIVDGGAVGRIGGRVRSLLLVWLETVLRLSEAERCGDVCC